MTHRGQTTNDYLIGIVLLLLTITVVFGFFPSMFAPFEEPVGSDEETMAANLGTELVSNTTQPGTEQTVNLTRVHEIIDSEPEALGNRSGVPGWKRWNVTVVDSNGQVVSDGTNDVVGGDDWNGSPAATTVRFVVAGDATDCEDGCRLVVRVW